MRELLLNDNIKKGLDYEIRWKDAMESVYSCALKAASTSLLQLRKSNYGKFRDLHCPADVDMCLTYPIPHLAFISIKICKAFRRIITSSGKNKGHAPYWALEALNLDDNYRRSAESGHDLYILFDKDVQYDYLTHLQRSIIRKHCSLQLIPEED